VLLQVCVAQKLLRQASLLGCGATTCCCYGAVAI
jgi:hypothetical protein